MIEIKFNNHESDFLVRASNETGLTIHELVLFSVLSCNMAKNKIDKSTMKKCAIFAVNAINKKNKDCLKNENEV